MDKSGANLVGVQEINLEFPQDQQIGISQVKYLNNMIEQDHRAIKRITKLMLGFKSFVSANATLTGIELYHMIRKGQNSNARNAPSWKQFYNIAA